MEDVDKAIEEALHRAILTLDAVADPDRRYLRARVTSWPAIKHDLSETLEWEPVRNTRFQPSRQDIDEFLERLDWITLAGRKGDYSLFRQRAYGVSWRRIADRRGRTDHYWRRRYLKALADVIEAQKSLQTCGKEVREIFA